MEIKGIKTMIWIEFIMPHKRLIMKALNEVTLSILQDNIEDNAAWTEDIYTILDFKGHWVNEPWKL